MFLRQTILACAVLCFTTLMATPAQAVIPYISGTYSTPSRQGTVSFSPVKRVIQFGYQGTFKIDGKNQPGVLYFPRTGGVGIAWNYGNSGLTAGNGIGSLQADGSYSGPIWFFDRKGNITDSGTVTFK